MLDSVLCQYEIDSSSKPCFEEEIIKCGFLEYVSNSPALQKAAASSAPISAKTQTKENKTSSAIMSICLVWSRSCLQLSFGYTALHTFGCSDLIT